jgi:hypothetical protein
MVSKPEVLQRLRIEPFVPFSVHTEDGSVHRILDRRQAMVTDRSIIIGIPRDESKPYGVFRDCELISLIDVVRLEPEVRPSVSSNGNAVASHEAGSRQ